MNTVAQLARHALDNNCPVTMVGVNTNENDALSRFNRLPFHMMENLQPQTCLILDVIQTFSSPSLVAAQDVAKKFEDIQKKIKSQGGCLALASQQMNCVCVLYPPTTSVGLDVERFYSSDIALLVRTLFPANHSIIDWLEYTESHIQKQRISNQIQTSPVSSRKKL